MPPNFTTCINVRNHRYYLKDDFEPSFVFEHDHFKAGKTIKGRTIIYPGALVWVGRILFCTHQPGECLFCTSMYFLQLSWVGFFYSSDGQSIFFTRQVGPKFFLFTSMPPLDIKW